MYILSTNYEGIITQIEDKLSKWFKKIKNSNFLDCIDIDYLSNNDIKSFLRTVACGKYEDEIKNEEFNIDKFMKYLDKYDKEDIEKCIKQDDINIFHSTIAYSISKLPANIILDPKSNNAYAKNLLIIQEILNCLRIEQNYKDILKLKFSYFLYETLDEPKKIIDKQKENKLFMFGVLSSKVSFDGNKNYNKFIDIYMSIKENNEIKFNKNSTIKHNQIFVIVQAFFLADRLNEIIDEPEYIDMIIKFILTKDKKDLEKSFTMLEGSNFTKTRLSMLNEEQMKPIPIDIFMKILSNSKK